MCQSTHTVTSHALLCERHIRQNETFVIHLIYFFLHIFTPTAYSRREKIRIRVSLSGREKNI